MKKVFHLLLLLSAVFYACSPVNQEADIAVTAVSISQPSAEMLVGETIHLKAIIQPSNATDKTVIWASSKTSVAMVTDDGAVTAIAPGESTVTAVAGGKLGSCRITVSKAEVAVTSVTLNQTELAMEPGQEVTLIATVLPEDATDKTLTWSSSDPSVALVADGKVTALKEGAAIISAKAGEKTAVCTVVVKTQMVPVTDVTLNKTTLTLEKGGSERLTATVSPADATDKTVSWSSSDSKVAAVSNDGTVTAISGGSSTITARAGDKTASCSVTVTVPVTSISLDRATVTLEENQSTVLSATVLPDDATDKTVTWSSSDASVASVTDGKVTALKEGAATITAKAGEKTAVCTVVVKKQVVPVTGVTLNKTTLTLEKGGSERLTATVSPADATDKTVSWSSSDSKVAAVSNDGTVTAVSGGSAIITARAGDKTASCSVTVTVPVTGITLNKTSLELIEGSTELLTATVSPSDATDKSVTWTSSDTGIVSVDAKGNVSALRAGNATVTARASGYTASCTVTLL